MSIQPPGFVDLQVNGYAGVDFSSPELRLEDIFAAAERLARAGTLAFLPTVITCAPETYQTVLPLLAQAIRDERSAGRLLGLHLEGPFLSPAEGAIGVHPPQYAQAPSPAAFDRLYELAGGQIALLTLAPELPGALELIHHAARLGVVVALGHTLADAETIHAAAAAGARASTHLGNGLPNTIHRHANPLWPQIADPALAALLITDGHHLPADFVRAVLAAKGPERVIATSDSAPPAGLPPGTYAFFGTTALLDESGRLRNLQKPTLAGSAATLLQCMNWLAGLGVLDEAQLWQAGRDNALALLGRAAASLPPPLAPVRWQGGRFVLAGDGLPGSATRRG